MSSQDFFNDNELAKLLGISVKALRNKLCAGHTLPPRIQPPGCKTRLWPKAGVYKWLDKYTITDSLDSKSIRRF